MLAESERRQLIEKLEQRREELGKQISCLSTQGEQIVEKKDTYEKGSYGRGTEASQDAATVCECAEALLKIFGRVVSRIEALRDFRFNAICPQCGDDIAIKDLMECPLMALCASCQKKANGIK